MDLRILPYSDDGLEMLGEFIAPDAAGPHPGVLVMPDARGIGDHARNAARKLAALGYAALVTDPYGGGLFHSGERMQEFHENPALLRSRSLAGYRMLAAQPEVDATRIAAIGYCFGGQTSLELARAGTDLRCVVSFHGVLSTRSPAPRGAVKGEVLVITGALDPYAPPEDVDAFRAEMAEAGASWQLTIYGNGLHQFTDPEAGRHMPGVPGLRYDPLLARLSWASAVAMLEATTA